MDESEKVINMLKYGSILYDHGFFEKDNQKWLDDAIRVLESIDPIIQCAIATKPCSSGPISDDVYNSCKFIANLMLFTDAMLPIADRYNPSDEMKEQIKNYILENEDSQK